MKQQDKKELNRIIHKKTMENYLDGLTDTDNNACFTVSQEPLFTADGTPTNYWCNRRDDNGVVVGQVSQHYSVIQHCDLLDKTELAFHNQGLSNFKKDTIVWNYGARMSTNYTFGNFTRFVKGTKMNKGDELAMRISVRNSHDGSSQALFRVGMLRLVCTNGMTSLTSEISANKRHKGVISLEFLSLGIAQAVTQFEGSLRLFGALADRDIKQREGEIILQHLVHKGTMSERFYKEVSQVWQRPSYQEDSGRNLYNLYNAITERVSRHYDERGQVEVSDRINTGSLTTLNRLMVDDSFFETVLTKTPSLN